jgi:hypothetical protein
MLLLLRAARDRCCGVLLWQEDDRDYLIRQLVAVKKDNARLRQELTKSKEDCEALKSAVQDNVRTSLCGVSLWRVHACVNPLAVFGCVAFIRACACCAVLCCAVLCCAVLCCAVLCCAVLCCAVLCCAVLRCAVLCCAALLSRH